MEIKILSSSIVPQSNPNSSPVEVPLTIFDRYVLPIYISVYLAFPPPAPTNSVIIRGLVKTLVHFPTLTARLGHGRRNPPCILVGGEGGGALVVEAVAASSLAEHLPLEPKPELQKLHPPGEDGKTLFQVQLNNFECGALIIGVTIHHRVADAQSMSNFFVAWSQSVRGASINPLPSYDQSWLKPATPPKCKFEHWGFDFMPISLQHDHKLLRNSPGTDPENISNVLLHYSPEFIDTKLKSQAQEKYTTFEILLAHVWRKVTMARGLDDQDLSTMAKFTMNGRPRLKPAIRKEYFGNLALHGHPNANAKDVIEKGIAWVASIVHEAKLRVGNEYFRSMIDFGEIFKKEDLLPVIGDTNVLFPNLEVTSWVGLGFEELDFGCGGKLCGFIPSWVPVDGFVMFLPSLQNEGGIDVLVCLIKEHARILKQICYSLD